MNNNNYIIPIIFIFLIFFEISRHKIKKKNKINIHILLTAICLNILLLIIYPAYSLLYTFYFIVITILSIRPLNFLIILKPKQIENYNYLIKKHAKVIIKLKNKYHDIKKLFKLKTHFYFQLSHEIKTNLTIINNRIEELLKTNNYNNIIQLKSNIENFKNSIMTYLLYEKLSNNKHNFVHNQTINLSKILEKKHTTFKKIAEKKQITILKKINENILIKADPIALNILINNLIDNAIKYNIPGGKIYIKLKSIDNTILFSIKDTGIGINPINLKNIFTPFFRENNIDIRNGFGIGLYLIKIILKELNGKIKVKSTLNKGSIFLIKLNSDKTNNKNHIHNINSIDRINRNPPLLEDTIIDKKKQNILIIEDHYDSLKLLKEGFENKYNVFISFNGKEAYLKLNTIPKPDIIICDMCMPVMNGIEFRKKCLTIDDFKSIPFIFITSNDSDKDKIRAFSYGVIDYIEKPFLLKDLKLKILNIIELLEINKLKNYNDFTKNLHLFIKSKGISNPNFNKIKILTGRELEIAQKLAAGKSYKEIASQLNLSEKTISSHASKIYSKLEISDRFELSKVLNPS